MAKGNLFQGMARGKVGDVVFYRMNGVQMSRVRNRAPKNPRSNEQLYQRAVIATVMKAYSAGKAIYDHAFQGYTVGEGCMRRFNSVNSRLLRSQLETDINEDRPLSTQIGRFVAPRSITHTPIKGLQISEGTLRNYMFTTSENAESGTRFNGANDNETIAQYLQRMQTVPGDIYTMVFDIVNQKDTIYQLQGLTSHWATQYNSSFEYVRLIVRDVEDDSQPIGTAKFSDVFIIENQLINLIFNEEQTIGKTRSISEIVTPPNQYWIGNVGVIRSRIDQDVRSTTYMNTYKSSNYGISSGYVLAAWQEEIQKIGVSELILEGGDGMNQTAQIENQSISGLPTYMQEEAALVNEPVQEGGGKTARHRGTRNNTEG